MLINFIKNNLFIQNLVGKIHSIIPPVVSHNLAKYEALKKAMYQTALEHTTGDYLEFGVFTGSSFNYAMQINRKLKYLGDMQTSFYGFDSFKGFGEKDKDDQHPFFVDDIFSINEKKVKKNIKKLSRGSKFRLIDGFFEDSIKGKSANEFGITNARVVLVDCDLRAPTEIALDFIKPTIQEGTIILFDEYNCYKGNVKKGEYVAFEKFKEGLSEFSFRRIFDYGYSGRAFIAYKNK